MTLNQLRCIHEVVLQGFSMSRAALVLNTTQPAISKIVKSLEDELGGSLFIRSRKRVLGLTEMGSDVHELAKRMLRDAARLSEIAAERFNQKTGALKITTTHLHARYALLKVIPAFKLEYPEVDIQMTHGDPQAIVAAVASGESHIGVSTLPEKLPDEVLTLPAYEVERCVITPLGHPLTRLRKVKVSDVVQYPLITYDRVFVAGRSVLRTFEQKGLRPHIAIKATDADVIKALVASGLGIAVFQTMAVESRDTGLAVVPARHLFRPSTVFIVLRRGQFLRRFVYDFIVKLNRKWTREAVREALDS